MHSYWSSMPRVSIDFEYRGIEAALLENEHLRITLLPGKGGDILEFRDKKADVDVLWHAEHNWLSPGETSVPESGDGNWMRYYPGGWQLNLPLAGWGGTVSGTSYAAHGESALLAWDVEVLTDTAEEVSIGLSVELSEYPLSVERQLTLSSGRAALQISESITNEGAVPVEYIWQHHVTLGAPLLGPDARLDIPAETGQVDPSYGDNDVFENGRLASGERFDWPDAPLAEGGVTDLREIPPQEARLHDQAYALDLEDGWYGLTNPDLDLGFGLRFPTDPFEAVWYWQALGGYENAPLYGRNYNVGIEPTSAFPAGSVPEAQRENGTMKTVDPGESVSADLTAATYHGLESVSNVSPDGSVTGTEH